MPYDKPEAEAVQTTRRTFLARAAIGGALVSVATAGPLGQLLPAAAQDGDSEPSDALTDAQVAAQLTPLELGAVQAYEAAAGNDALDLDVSDAVRRFQRHHQTAADRLGAMASADAPTPTADPTIVEGTVAAVTGAGDQNAVLSALAEMEETLAATHLWALAAIPDQVTARLVLQIQATESQQAVVLSRVAGTSIDELTPATAPIADGLPAGSTPPPPADEAPDEEADGETGDDATDDEGEN